MSHRQRQIRNSNTGLHALQRQIVRRRPRTLEGGSVPADVLASTDGIAIAFDDDISPAQLTEVKKQIQVVLGPGWDLRDESLNEEGIRFSGITALPPLAKPP